MDGVRLGMLTVADPATAAPPHPQEDEPGVFTWLNLDGSVWGRGFSADGERWLSFPGVARFRLGPGTGEAVAVPDAGAELERIVDHYRRCVLPMALHASGLEVLHASAVLTERGVVALCGRARTGKSTTAFALSLRGHSLWADDAVPFELSGGVARAIPQPFRLRLRRSAGDFFFARAPEDAFTVATEWSFERAPDPTPIAAIVLLERGAPDTRVELGRVGAAEALTRIVEHAYWYDLREPGRKRTMMQRYAELVAAVPVWGIRFPPGFEVVDELLDAIERALADEGAP